ncbi:MAG: cysteine--tRNA ligase [Eubacteriales bacterium]
MRFYNTLTQSIQEFKPITEGKVLMYVCGPTVYNLIHIGNARPMIVFDTARRYMMYKGYDVNYVSNFTDVDDKIINKANEEGVTAQEISQRYIAETKKDMADMNVLPATTHPLATQEIPEMIALISDLEKKGFAYNVNGTVYFRTRKDPDYGKLSHKNLDDLRSGFRDLKVSGEDQKEDPLDFVLWKPMKPGEPYWDSPWGKGRPGWHTECCVMSRKYLHSTTIDIHAGGEDLIFPHHENEIAQVECSTGQEFAHYWLHNAFLNINNEKMSKSLGNFLTVRDVGKKYDLQVLRFFMLSAHYRRVLNFSEESMEAAKASLGRIRTAVRTLNDHIAHAKTEELTEEERAKLGVDENGQPIALEVTSDPETGKLILPQDMRLYRWQFEQAMDDDLNTADAEAAIFNLVKFANIEVTENSSRAFAEAVKKEICELSDILGLIVDVKEDSLDEEIEKKIEERQAARKAKDFARADAIRDELLAKGIVLKDTRDGVRWERV